MSLGPGPTVNTLGEFDGDVVVDIEGTETYPTAGNLNMTTVSQQDALTLGQAIAFWIGGRDQLVPRALIYPPDRSREEIDQDNTDQFRRSEDDAESAALGYLDYSSAVTVGSVGDPGPSLGKLQDGDAIDAVDGKPVANLDEFTGLMEQTRPGQQVVIDYRRKNAPAGAATITLGNREDGKPHGLLGISVFDSPWAPFDIDFHLANIGGPSAGLMFSLAVIDKLTEGELNGAQFIAGTGTITADGEVGPIGGITHKILAAREAGATVFLVPSDNCDEARSAHEDIELVRVDTLTGAVDALNTLSAGGEPPGC